MRSVKSAEWVCEKGRTVKAIQAAVTQIKSSNDELCFISSILILSENSLA